MRHSRKLGHALHVFIGYQFDSEFHSPTNFDKLSAALAAHARSRLPNVKIVSRPCNFAAGTELWAEVRHAILLSDVCIFDISDNNPNVLLEAGVSFGQGRQTILLRTKRARRPVPSDLRAFLYLDYGTPDEFVTRGFLDKLVDALGRFLEEGHEPYFYHRRLWCLEPESRTLIIPGRLPKRYTRNNPFEDYVYLRRYSDLDALLSVTETLSRLYPAMETSLQAADTIDDLPRHWQEHNLVLVGGPDYNRLVRSFQHLCPIGYRYDKSGEDVWLFHKRKRREYRPKFFMRDGVPHTTDYGFFVKTRIQSKSRRRLIFIGGARTWGVFGATKVVACESPHAASTPESPARRIVERFGSESSLLLPIEVTGSAVGLEPPVWRIEDVESLEQSGLRAR